MCRIHTCVVKSWHPLGVPHYRIARLARCGRNDRFKRNIARNLHKEMQNNGQMLDAKLKYVPIPIRSDRRTAKIQHVSYPTLPLSSWVECLFMEEPRLLLGGCDLGDEGFREVLGVFWQRYRGTDPGLPLFAEDVDTSFCIPYMLHGDEGRGKVRRQVMVLSFQPMISFKGLSHLNTSG